MGRVTKWLSCLLGTKKEGKDRKVKCEVYVGECKEKRRWSFARPREAAATAGNAARSSVSDLQAWSRTCYDDEDAENSRRAIAVAMATSAAAAGAAATAAHAAALRLSSLGRERAMRNRVYNWWAAVKIQAAFRGHLARKALRTLKAMVKLQALIRGSLVRRQTAATLQQLQALVRIQTLNQTRRCSRLLQEGRAQWIRQEIFPRRSFEKTHGVETRIKYFASADCQGLDRSPKVVDMDTCQAKLRLLRRTNSHMLHPPEELPSSPTSSPFKFPARIVIPEFRSSQDCNYRIHTEKGRHCKTAHNTPRYSPATPTKGSVAVDGLLRHALHAPTGPNYMAKTRSSSAKTGRMSQSTPRQHRSAPESPRLIRKRMQANDTGNGVVGYRSQVLEARKLKNLMAGRPDEAAVEVTREEPRDHFFEQKESRDYYLDVMW